MKQGLQELKKTWQRFGAKAAILQVVDRLGRAAIGLQVVEVIWLEPEGIKFSLDVDPQFEFRFLKSDEVAKFAAEQANDLDAAMLERAATGRDLCFAALTGDRLAAYGWYALKEIEAEHNFGVAMSFPANVAYMYKGFTHPEFRGARLHGLGMGLALKNLAQFGVNRLVSTVAWTNTASMQSCDRIGYQRLGRLVTIGAKTFHVAHAPSIALDLGVRFGASKSPRSAPSEIPLGTRTRHAGPHAV